MGWATVTEETAGLRSRNRYTITDSGRAALAEWLTTKPEEPHFQIEGVLRIFFADQAGPVQLESAIRTTAESAQAMLEEVLGFVGEYLEEGGPLWMLEQGVSGPDQERIEFRGRAMHPERLQVVALAIDVVTQLLETISTFFGGAIDEVADWPSTTDPSVTAVTRQRLERIRSRSTRTE